MRAHGRQGALVERFHQFAAEAAPTDAVVLLSDQNDPHVVRGIGVAHPLSRSET